MLCNYVFVIIGNHQLVCCVVSLECSRASMWTVEVHDDYVIIYVYVYISVCRCVSSVGQLLHCNKSDLS